MTTPDDNDSGEKLNDCKIKIVSDIFDDRDMKCKHNSILAWQKEKKLSTKEFFVKVFNIINNSSRIGLESVFHFETN